MKKVPQWMEDPAFVFDSDTEQGRLVFVAKEHVNSSPVVIIVEPAESKVDGHVMVNAYERTNGKTPFNRWVDDGLLRYYDRNKSAALDRSGLQSARLSQARRSDKSKVYRDSDLVKYRDSTPVSYPKFSVAAQNTLQSTETSDQQRIEKAITGKSATEVLQYLIDNAPNFAYELIATRAKQAIKKSGAPVGFTITHIGDSVPIDLIDRKGSTDLYHSGKIEIRVNGVDTGEKSGMDMNILLHEFVHAATIGLSTTRHLSQNRHYSTLNR